MQNPELGCYYCLLVFFSFVIYILKYNNLKASFAHVFSLKQSRRFCFLRHFLVRYVIYHCGRLILTFSEDTTGLDFCRSIGLITFLANLLIFFIDFQSFVEKFFEIYMINFSRIFNKKFFRWYFAICSNHFQYVKETRLINAS